MPKLLWSQKQNIGPGPRVSHAMAFDSKRGHDDERALHVFQDSLTVWSFKVKGDGLNHSSFDRWLWVGADEDKQVFDVILKHGLPVMQNYREGTARPADPAVDSAKKAVMFFSDPAIHALWDSGSKALAAANAGYLSP